MVVVVVVVVVYWLFVTCFWHVFDVWTLTLAKLGFLRQQHHKTGNVEAVKWWWLQCMCFISLCSGEPLGCLRKNNKKRYSKKSSQRKVATFPPKVYRSNSSPNTFCSAQWHVCQALRKGGAFGQMRLQSAWCGDEDHTMGRRSVQLLQVLSQKCLSWGWSIGPSKKMNFLKLEWISDIQATFQMLQDNKIASFSKIQWMLFLGSEVFDPASSQFEPPDTVPKRSLLDADFNLC